MNLKEFTYLGIGILSLGVMLGGTFFAGLYLGQNQTQQSLGNNQISPRPPTLVQQRQDATDGNNTRNDSILAPSLKIDSGFPRNGIQESNLVMSQNNANRSLTGQLMRVNDDLLTVRTDRKVVTVRMHEETRFQLIQTIFPFELTPGMTIRINGAIEENREINASLITILSESTEAGIPKRGK